MADGIHERLAAAPVARLTDDDLRALLAGAENVLSTGEYSDLEKAPAREVAAACQEALRRGWHDRPFVDVVFDDGPGPVCSRFVETEDGEGHGVGIGDWIERPDGLWALRIPTPTEPRLPYRIGEHAALVNIDGVGIVYMDEAHDGEWFDLQDLPRLLLESDRARAVTAGPYVDVCFAADQTFDRVQGPDGMPIEGDAGQWVELPGERRALRIPKAVAVVPFGVAAVVVRGDVSMEALVALQEGLPDGTLLIHFPPGDNTTIEGIDARALNEAGWYRRDVDERLVDRLFYEAAQAWEMDEGVGLLPQPDGRWHAVGDDGQVLGVGVNPTAALAAAIAEAVHAAAEASERADRADEPEAPDGD